MSDDPPTYWLPSWWDWTDCAACLRYNHTPCASCEIPPGVLAMVQLVGGGVATVAGAPRGNTAVTSQRQARAVERMGVADSVVLTASDLTVDVQQQNQARSRLERNSNLNLDR